MTSLFSIFRVDFCGELLERKQDVSAAETGGAAADGSALQSAGAGAGTEGQARLLPTCLVLPGAP